MRGENRAEKQRYVYIPFLTYLLVYRGFYRCMSLKRKIYEVRMPIGIRQT